MFDIIPAPSSMTIIETLFQELDLLLNNYVFNAYTALAQYLKTPLALAMILTIVILGWSITQGHVKLSMSNLLKTSVKLALVYTAAMKWGWFSHTVVNLINVGAGQLGQVLIDATPVPIPHVRGSGINGAMQFALIEFVKIGGWIWNKGSWNNMGPYFTAGMIWAFGYALILIAVIELALAKIMLAILFATAPLFVGFTLFKPTHTFFDRWLGACVGFGLLMIFVSSMLALALSMAQWAIGTSYIDHAVGINLVGYIPIMVVGALGIGIILKAAQLAQSIGGTVTTSSGSALLAGTVGGLASRALPVVKGTGGASKKLMGMGNSGSKKLMGLGGAIGQNALSSMRAIRSSLTKP